MNQDVRIRYTGFDNYYRTWHTLNRNMILYVHSGTGSIFGKDCTYPMTPGCLCFVGSNTMYYTLPDVPAEYYRSKLFLSNKDLEAALALFPDHPEMRASFSPTSILYAQIPEEDRDMVEALFDEIEPLLDDDRYLKAMIFSHFVRMMVQISLHATDRVYSSTGVIQKSIEYINEHIGEDIGISDICENIHVSKYYFCRRFKQSTGLTVMNHILKTRVNVARSLMENDKLTVGQISERCGFSSQSYFSRVFKQETGMTPLQYQKRLPNRQI